MRDAPGLVPLGKILPFPGSLWPPGGQKISFFSSFFVFLAAWSWVWDIPNSQGGWVVKGEGSQGGEAGRRDSRTESHQRIFGMRDDRTGGIQGEEVTMRSQRGNP